MLQLLLKIRIDAWISLTLLLVCTYLYTIAGKFPAKAALFPNVLLLSTIVLCSVVFLQSIRKGMPSESAKRRCSWKQKPVTWAIAVYLMIAAYFFALNLMGFIVSTMIFVSATMRYFGERKCIAIVSAAIGLNVFVYLTFCLFLDVPLPMLPSFFK